MICCTAIEILRRSFNTSDYASSSQERAADRSRYMGTVSGSGLYEDCSGGKLMRDYQHHRSRHAASPLCAQRDASGLYVPGANGNTRNGRQPADGLVPASSHPSVSESARPSTVEL